MPRSPRMMAIGTNPGQAHFGFLWSRTISKVTLSFSIAFRWPIGDIAAGVCIRFLEIAMDLKAFASLNRIYSSHE